MFLVNISQLALVVTIVVLLRIVNIAIVAASDTKRVKHDISFGEVRYE
jgi:hypothetical protein